jgi:hypothetical protein
MDPPPGSFGRLTKLVDVRAVAEDGGHRLDRDIWRAKAGIVGLAIGAALVTFIALPNRIPPGLLAALTAAFVAVIYFLACNRLKKSDEVETAAPQLKRPSFLPQRRADEAAQNQRAARRPIATPSTPASTQSAAGFLERFRRNLLSGESEDEGTAQRPGRPNDLRHYLNQRLTASATERASDVRMTEMPATRPIDAVATTLTSFDVVLSHVFAWGRGGPPRALLVGRASEAIDARVEAIAIARAFVAADEQVVLLDLAQGSISLSDLVALPHSPGLSELCAGSARFEDIITIDAETPLHLIAAGARELAVSGDENNTFTAIFAALTATYDSVVLHADRAALRKFAPALRFELPIAVAVTSAAAREAATDLSLFAALGCPVVVYEKGAKERRAHFLGWAASI